MTMLDRRSEPLSFIPRSSPEAPTPVPYMVAYGRGTTPTPAGVVASEPSLS